MIGTDQDVEATQKLQGLIKAIAEQQVSVTQVTTGRNFLRVEYEPIVVSRTPCGHEQGAVPASSFEDQEVGRERWLCRECGQEFTE